MFRPTQVRERTRDAHSPTTPSALTEDMSGFWFENRSSDRRARGLPASAMCIQRFDDSLSPAIHTRYRISLRSSSLREPRYPLLRVVLDFDSGLRLSTDAAFRVIRIVRNRLNGLCVYRHWPPAHRADTRPKPKESGLDQRRPAPGKQVPGFIACSHGLVWIGCQ